MAKRKYLITGANGQVGKEIRALAAQHPEADFFFQGREDMPLENFQMIRTVLQSVNPDVVINCAAYTAVDNAETSRELAFQINSEAVGVISAVCNETGARFIHISTDYVFDGNGSQPYRETDPTSPVNTYGASKLEGEEQAFRFHPDTIVVRTSWVFSSFGKNFVKTMLRLMGERNEVSVVNDQYGCPTYARDLASFILTLASRSQVAGGIYHFSNAGPTTWYEFAKAIGEMAGSGCIVKPITTEQFPTPAKRPHYSVLDTGKIQAGFGITPRHWRESLRDCLTLILST